MNTKTKLLGVIAILSIVVFVAASASRAGVETGRTAASGSHTTIRINGMSSDTFLVDDTTGTNGFLNVGRDQIANTTSLDFAYVTPDTVDLDIVYFIHGTGEIPNSAFTISSGAAHLAVTTAFEISSCVVNLVTADYDCQAGNPITFDLTWANNGFATIHEKTQRRETFGPVTTKFQGEFDSKSATVNGTWTGHTAQNLFGNLVDSKNRVNIREITVESNN